MSSTLSCIIPNSGPLVGKLGLAAMARTAEEAGADGLWVSDHVLMVDRPVTTYPYSDDGSVTWATDTDYYEALSVLAFLAGVTVRCRLGTAVLVIPQRNVLQLAKEIATIDRLSDGRVDLGVGAGWYRDEMTALGYDFASRGSRMEDMITVLGTAWSGRTEQLQTAALSVESGLILQPTPVQVPGPPVYIGGTSRTAIRRAARLADGWLALAYADAWDACTLRSQLDVLADESSASARDSRPRTILKLHRGALKSVDRMTEVVLDAVAAGFDEVILELPWGEGLISARDEFEQIRQVVPKAGRSTIESGRHERRDDARFR